MALRGGSTSGGRRAQSRTFWRVSPEARGHLNERGKRYAATAISRMLASSETRRDVLMEALAANPRFKLLPRTGKGLSSRRAGS